ncbi:ornithine cyclodeaminase family protein [Sinosporangium siamense]|uniref:Ornithine cyclodeaminase n=1 Tax=Sinosporangium siamense TaxID=1367973 RepID=A0A919V8Z0_9ACTN|nr:ornithine cyclodeaminase family protein [Sinosporangium siamense]GII96630.1 ornithine cyclodeaminase [Sinosporangium siamense]
MSGPPYLDGETLRDLVPMGRAVQVVREALLAGLDPEETPPRAAAEVPAGQVLMMPAHAGRYVGIKVVGVAPDNPARGLPRIQAVYVLLDGGTLTPLAFIDGIALTTLRTPAVSAVAVDALALPYSRTMTVFGCGPQAVGHVEAFRAVRDVERVTVVGRAPARVAAAVEACRALGVDAEPGTADSVAEAELIACCTTAREPLFPGRLARDDATVVAVGSHEPEAREVDDALVARSTVVVESRSAALAEAGDLIIPLRGGSITTPHLAGNLAELVRGRVTRGAGPAFFKSVGMAWEDLVVAVAAYEAWTAR